MDQKGDITQVFKTQNPNDVWALPDGEVLIAWKRGVKIYDNAGELKFEWASSEKRDEIHSRWRARRSPSWGSSATGTGVRCSPTATRAVERLRG